jgi:carbonic anhydrase/acetyltransferase-like protein (isoleucine patch superfamily)
MLAGVPAKIIREVTEEDLKISRAISLRYIELGQKYAQGQFQWNTRTHRMVAYPVKGI